MICRRSVTEKYLSFISYYNIYFDYFPITLAQIFSLNNQLLPNPFTPDFSLRNTHCLINHSPWFLSPQSLACSQLTGTWSSAVQLATWLLDWSHQPCFGQTCSPIDRSLPTTQSLVFCLPHINPHPGDSLHIFHLATFELNILWNIPNFTTKYRW